MRPFSLGSFGIRRWTTACGLPGVDSLPGRRPLPSAREPRRQPVGRACSTSPELSSLVGAQTYFGARACVRARSHDGWWGAPREVRARPLFLFGPPSNSWRQLQAGASRADHQDWGANGQGVGSCCLERLLAELSQDVVGLAGELAGDRQRRPVGAFSCCDVFVIAVLWACLFGGGLGRLEQRPA